MRAWLCLAGSKHRPTVPFGLGTIKNYFTIQLSHWLPGEWLFAVLAYAVFFFGNKSCNASGTKLVGAWYGFMPSLTYNENVPLMDHRPETKYFVMQFSVIFLLATCQLLSLAPQENNPISWLVFVSIGRSIFEFLFDLDLSWLLVYLFPVLISLYCVALNTQ